MRAASGAIVDVFCDFLAVDPDFYASNIKSVSTAGVKKCDAVVAGLGDWFFEFYCDGSPVG